MGRGHEGEKSACAVLSLRVQLLLLGALFALVTAKIEIRIVPAIVKLGILSSSSSDANFELEHGLRI
jgi:hypothetical protein